ncbi:hypothetical protein EDC04DRAFT_2697461 [Pisolithus marmoratus]|nr:hypothetical protein EDC04DRAFT_2697461 [Pisolithus marmoratus]
MHNSTSTVSSWPSSPHPVMPLHQGSHVSDYLDSENITTLQESTSTASFIPQPYPLPIQQTEITPSPITTHVSPYTLPTLYQSNSNAQIVDLHAPALTPTSSNLPVPFPGETFTHDSSSNIRNGNLPIPAGLPMTTYAPSVSMLRQLKGDKARSCTRVRRRVKTEGCSWPSERISTRRAGPLAKIQSRIWTRPSAVRSSRDPDVPVFCGWQNEDGEPCGERVSYVNCAEHFAAFHDIKSMAKDVEVLCRWCPLSGETKIIRKNILRHLREVHLCCRRLKKQDCTDANDTTSSL